MTAQTAHRSRFTGLRVTNLGFPAGFAVWSFRVFATGHGHCCPVVYGMNHALGSLGDEARVRGLSLAQTIAETSRRTMHLASPGCLGVTYDEICLIAAIEAAQNKRAAQRDAQLAWLLGRKADGNVIDAIQKFAEILAEGGIGVKTPAPQTKRTRKTTELFSKQQGDLANVHSIQK